MRSLAFTVMVATVAACKGEPAPVSRQLGDTTFVHSAQPRRAAATLREVLRIGALDGPPEYLLSGVTMLAVGPTGSIYVAQNDGDLRQFDADGVFVRTVARPGQGPGEVGYVVGIDVADDGHLAVVDFGNQRVSVYAPDGTFLRQVRRPPGRPGYGRDAVRWDVASRLWIALHPPRSGPDSLPARRPLFGRLRDDGEVADTVFLPQRAWDNCERRRPGYAGGFFEDSRIPYLPFAQWSRTGQGALVFGCSAGYVFEVLDATGGATRVSRAWEPEVMSSDEHAFYSLIQEVNTGLPRPRFSIPRARPAFLRIWAADDGRIWVWPGGAGSSRTLTPEQQASMAQVLPGRAAPSEAWSYWSPTDGLDVFTDQGEWVGHVDTPENWEAAPYPGLEDPVFKGDTIWAITTDDLDVSYVSKFVVEWPSTS